VKANRTAPTTFDTPWKPTPQQLRAAVNNTVPDLIAPGLKVLFCGINPGLYSAAVRHHFARPGNRFWPTLHAAGFTPTQFSPFEERRLLELGYGITNVVERATAAAAELSKEELIDGAGALARKVRRYRPGFLAVLGVGAYRAAFDRRRAVVGPQEEIIGATRIWVLPNPSGLNANYQREQLTQIFRALREASE
jgi:TDG/mug DNA glycosylase family protein